MRLLLDTHTFLWFIAGDLQLSQSARSLIEDLENERFLSMASLWEIAIKTSLGKLNMIGEGEEFAEFLQEQTWRNSITLLPISLPHLAAVAQLPQHHRDPFDRLLMAQAQTENLTILSADAALDAYGIARRW
jgi:PIN domain nuclease of toxin-antitoxin system